MTTAQLHSLTDVVTMAVAPLSGSLRDVERVLHNTCPVPFFGDALTARIATVGLNPSDREFEDTLGRTRAASRLPTRHELQINDWTSASGATCSQIAHACSDYFEGNPYRRYFNPLDTMLRGIGDATLYGGGACHLDLVPWATRPKWGGLSKRERQLLLHEGRPVLDLLLASTRLEALLLNGTTVVNAFQRAGAGLRCEHVNDWTIGRGRGRRWWGTIRKTGGYELKRPIAVLGWSGHIPLTPMTASVRQSIFDWTAAELR